VNELTAAGIADPRLRADYAYCRSVAQRHGRTYFLATRLLTPDRRPAVHALYSFARTADDVVDHPGTTPAGQEAGLDCLTHDLASDRPAHPVCRAVRDTVRRHDIDPSLHAEFMASMRMDLTVTEYATFADLQRYMRGSAEVIGLQMVPVLGTVVPRAEAEPHAAALGVAFQLTNFIRDVGEDLDRGRIYLPQESLRAAGVTREHLARRVVDAPVRKLLRGEIARTRAIYRRAEPGIEMIDPVSRDCVRTAFLLYRDILDEIERRDYQVLDRRLSVPNRRRLSVAVPALAHAWRTRLGHRPGASTRPA
jgi:15-cis-phytoene synthase